MPHFHFKSSSFPEGRAPYKDLVTGGHDLTVRTIDTPTQIETPTTLIAAYYGRTSAGYFLNLI